MSVKNALPGSPSTTLFVHIRFIIRDKKLHLISSNAFLMHFLEFIMPQLPATGMQIKNISIKFYICQLIMTICMDRRMNS